MMRRFDVNLACMMWVWGVRLLGCNQLIIQSISVLVWLIRIHHGSTCMTVLWIKKKDHFLSRLYIWRPSKNHEVFRWIPYSELSLVQMHQVTVFPRRFYIFVCIYWQRWSDNSAKVKTWRSKTSLALEPISIWRIILTLQTYFIKIRLFCGVDFLYCSAAWILCHVVIS